MSKFCTSCGNPLDGNGRFCTSCGAPVSSRDSVNDDLGYIEDDIVQEHVQYDPFEHKKADKTKLAKKNKENNSGGCRKVLKIGLIFASLVILLFIGVGVFLINAIDSSFTADEFEGDYSGIMQIEEIAIGMGENPEDLLNLVEDLQFPIRVTIAKDDVYDGRWIMRKPSTLEEDVTIIFGGEYDQILGDTTRENGSREFIQAIVDTESDPFRIEGYYERNSEDETMKVVYSFSIQKVETLQMQDDGDVIDELSSLVSDYMDGFIEDNEVDSQPSDTGTDDAVVSDTIKGYYALDIKDDYTGGYIIFSKGNAPESDYMEPVEFDMPGWAFVMFGEDPLILNYRDGSTIYAINRYIRTQSEDVYVDGVQIVKIEDTSSDPEDSDVFRPKYSITPQEVLPGGTYLNDDLFVLQAILSDGVLTGSLSFEDLQEGRTFVIEFQSK